MANKIKIFSGRATQYLAEKIAQSYGTELGKAVVTEFCDGEFQPSFEENIRGNDIFIVQSTFAPASNFLNCSCSSMQPAGPQHATSSP